MNACEKLTYDSALKKVTADIFMLSISPSIQIQPVNCYLIKGENGFTIVDTGVNDKVSKRAWEELISLGLVIEKVVFTHAHIDHIGLAGWLQEKYCIPVYVSNLQYEEMIKIRSNSRPEWIKSLLKKHGHDGVDFSRVLEKGFPIGPYQFEPDKIYENHQKIRLGNELYQAIWTPGHSKDHFSFYNPKKKIMISGDLILDRISPIIANWSPDEMNPLQDYFQSLNMVKEYSPKLLLPGHGQIIKNVSGRIEEIQSKHNSRLEKILALLVNNAKTLHQVSREIYGNLDTHIFAPLLATISRAVYLESIGKVTSELRDGKIYYKKC